MRVLIGEAGCQVSFQPDEQVSHGGIVAYVIVDLVEGSGVFV